MQGELRKYLLGRLFHFFEVFGHCNIRMVAAALKAHDHLCVKIESRSRISSVASGGCESDKQAVAPYFSKDEANLFHLCNRAISRTTRSCLQ
jgi:hypothetical protein